MVINGLQAQVTSLESEINNLSASIDVLSASPPGAQTSTEVADLVEQRSEDTSQVAQVESQIQQEQLNEQAVTQASHVLDPAAAITVSAKKVTVVDALSGLVAGLGLAVIALVIGVLLSDRLRTRAEVAAALGAPVELSVSRWGPRGRIPKRRRQQFLVRPTQPLTMIGRRLRAHLESAGGPGLVVAEVEASEACALAVAILAFALSSEGRRVAIVDMAHGRPVAALLDVKGRDKRVHNVTLEGQSVALIVAPEDPAEMNSEWVPKGVDAVLTLASVDPALGAEHLAPWARKAVVVVDAGKASAARISATGALLRQAKMTVRSAILVGLDPEDDDSLGLPGADGHGDTRERANGVLQAARR